MAGNSRRHRKSRTIAGALHAARRLLHRPTHRAVSLRLELRRRAFLLFVVGGLVVGGITGNTIAGILKPHTIQDLSTSRPPEATTTPSPQVLTEQEAAWWLGDGCTTPDRWPNEGGIPSSAVVRVMASHVITSVPIDRAFELADAQTAWVLALCADPTGLPE